MEMNNNIKLDSYNFGWLEDRRHKARQAQIKAEIARNNNPTLLHHLINIGAGIIDKKYGTKIGKTIRQDTDRRNQELQDEHDSLITPRMRRKEQARKLKESKKDLKYDKKFQAKQHAINMKQSDLDAKKDVDKEVENQHKQDLTNHYRLLAKNQRATIQNGLNNKADADKVKNESKQNIANAKSKGQLDRQRNADARKFKKVETLQNMMTRGQKNSYKNLDKIDKGIRDLSKVPGKVAKASNQIANNVKAELPNVKAKIQASAKLTGDAMVQGAQKAGQAIKQGATQAGTAIKSAAQSAGSGIKSGLQTAGTAIKSTAQKAGTGITTGVKTAGDGVVKAGKFVGGGLKKFGGKVKSVASDLSKKGKNKNKDSDFVNPGVGDEGGGKNSFSYVETIPMNLVHFSKKHKKHKDKDDKDTDSNKSNKDKNDRNNQPIIGAGAVKSIAGISMLGLVAYFGYKKYKQLELEAAENGMSVKEYVLAKYGGSITSKIANAAPRPIDSVRPSNPLLEAY